MNLHTTQLKNQLGSGSCLQKFQFFYRWFISYNMCELLNLLSDHQLLKNDCPVCNYSANLYIIQYKLAKLQQNLQPELSCTQTISNTNFVSNISGLVALILLMILQSRHLSKKAIKLTALIPKPLQHICGSFSLLKLPFIGPQLIT